MAQHIAAEMSVYLSQVLSAEALPCAHVQRRALRMRARHTASAEESCTDVVEHLLMLM
jgi:hypothetical protein